MECAVPDTDEGGEAEVAGHGQVGTPSKYCLVVFT